MSRKAVSGMMLTLLLIGTLTLALDTQSVEASGTIYIRPDGSIDPPTAPIQRVADVYTFTDDIYNNSIVVQRDGITLDGNRHLLQGPTTGRQIGVGIHLRWMRNVTITDIIISNGFTYGIFLDGSSNCRIVNNILGDCWYGIKLSESSHNLLTGNTIKSMYKALELVGSNYNTLSNNKVRDNIHGIWLSSPYFDQSGGNILRDNVMTSNKYSFLVYSHYSLLGYINDVDTSNTVDGRPIYYWINRHDESAPLDAGCVVIVNSSRMTVENLRLRNTGIGVCLAYTRDSVIENVIATTNFCGIWLQRSDYNVITKNNFTDNDGPGIFLDLSHHNSLTDNFVRNSNSSGIWIEDTSYNTLIGNTVLYSRTGHPGQEWDGAGILVDDSNYCTVIDNDVTSNSYGMVVGATPATDNQISGNNIAMNGVGLFLACCSDNAIYHNNFIDNTLQVDTGEEMWEPGHNNFDSGYPSGGNYWSDYDGVDVKKGSNQDHPGSDGVGDTPYITYDNHADHYPLMNPLGSPSPPTYTLLISTAINGTTDPAPGTYTYSKGQDVPVQAIPDTGYILDHWELDGANVGTANPISVTMNLDHTLHAVFILAYTLTITTTAGGKTNPRRGTYTYIVGTVVGVSATPYPGYYFDHWKLDGVNNTVNPMNVTMNMDHTLRAVFTRISYTLAITTTVDGTTDPTPGTYTHWSGSIVSVTAISDSGYYLDYWELDGVNIGAFNPVNVLMETDHTLHAAFAQLSSGHDVAVKGLSSRSVVGQGCPLTIKALAMNVGGYTETFNVTGYANTTIIGTVTSITLTSGNSTTIAFTWNTTGVDKGNYTITARATPVPDETDTTDNNFTDGIIEIRWPYDVTRDGYCGIDDIAVVAEHFGTSPGHPDWDPIYDANCDDYVGIDDIVAVAEHFGETDP